MLDTIRRWFEPRILTPAVPEPDVSSDDERRRIDERQREVRARLELLRIESELPASRQLEKRGPS